MKLVIEHLLSDVNYVVIKGTTNAWDDKGKPITVNHRFKVKVIDVVIKVYSLTKTEHAIALNGYKCRKMEDN